MVKDRDLTGHRRWLLLFATITVLVLAQVAWWAYVFIDDVDQIASLREALLRATGVASSTAFTAIENGAFHRRIMFLSETTFFGLLTLAGLFLLYRGFKADRKTRELQRSFIEIVSHESKTPVTALKLRLGALRDKRKDDAEVVRGTGLCLEQVERLSSILEKALDLNRIERRAFQFEEVVLSDIVHDVVHRLEPLARAKAVRVEAKIAGDPRVWGDLYCLRNSVQNLVENAIIYNDAERKQVDIELSSRQAFAELVVQDNGPGISREDERRLFERFYRGAQSGSVPGTGLGLYLTRVIVEAHSGVIKMIRSPLGIGVRFGVTIPLMAERES